MRFAWLREHASNDVAPDEQSITDQIAFAVYNVAWWVPIVLPITKLSDYGTGFAAFAIVTGIRLSANLFRINMLAPDKAQRFPFRAP